MTNAIEMKGQFEGLQARAKEAAYGLQAAIPVSNLSDEAQEAFLLAFSDLKLLEHLLETAQSTLNAITLEESPKAEDNEDDFSSGLSDLVTQLLDILCEQFGVSKNLVLPAVTKDMARQLELIETILKRCEAEVSTIKA